MRNSPLARPVHTSVDMQLSVGWIVVGALMLAACSGAPDRAPPPESQEIASDADPELDPGEKPAPSKCETGDTRSCKVQLPTHDNIETCYVGVNLCVDGVWSECGEEDSLVEKYLGS